VSVGEIVNGEKSTSNKKIIDNGAIQLVIKDRLPFILLTVGLQSAYHALTISQSQDLATVWMGIIFQLVTIFINVAIGLNYGSILFKKLDTNNLLTRRQYIMEYLVWKTKKNEKDLNLH
jgi:hypothetical protein